MNTSNKKQVWMEIETQNLDYLGETWGKTIGKMAQREHLYFSYLPLNLQTWVNYHMDNQTELWALIQGIYTTIQDLEFIIYREIGKKGIQKNHIGWAWHLLHSEL